MDVREIYAVSELACGRVIVEDRAAYDKHVVG